MMVKIFTADTPKDLEKQINDFLYGLEGDMVVSDIKFSTAIWDNYDYFTAMVILKTWSYV